MNRTPIRVALVGYGYAGRTFHAPLITSVPGLALAVVVSSDPMKVRESLPAVAVVPTLEAALTHHQIDLVVVATPNATHAPLARQALMADSHVVVDKPFTLTRAEAEALATLAASRGRLLSVFHNRRWDADFLTLRALVDDGTLGELVYFESRMDRYRPQVRARWREQRVEGSGLWFDLGPHLVDQALLLFGPPTSIMADVAVQRLGGLVDDHFHVVLRYPRARVVLHASMLALAPTPRLRVEGTRGSFVSLEADSQEEALKRGEEPTAPGFGAPPPMTLHRPDEPPSRPLALPGQYVRFYEGLRAAIAAGAPAPVSLSEAIAVVDVIERVASEVTLR